MPATIQIRNVPEDLHKRLKSRATLAGVSLSDYLLGQIREVAERPTLEELQERIRSRGSVNPPISPADAVRADRDSR